MLEKNLIIMINDHALIISLPRPPALLCGEEGKLWTSLTKLQTSRAKPIQARRRATVRPSIVLALMGGRATLRAQRVSSARSCSFSRVRSASFSCNLSAQLPAQVCCLLRGTASPRCCDLSASLSSETSLKPHTICCEPLASLLLARRSSRYGLRHPVWASRG